MGECLQKIYGLTDYSGWRTWILESENGFRRAYLEL
jgi:hypothetical protein